MKKNILFIILLISFYATAQEDAWVYFNSKSNEQNYYNAPLTILSQKALDRRTKQKISVDFKDIPINPLFLNQIKAVSGITVKAKSKWLNALHIQGTVTMINSLKTLSFVDRVDFANKALNLSSKNAKVKKLNNKSKTLETQINFDYGVSENQIKMLNGDQLHQQNFTGDGKIIAVLDAGFPGVDNITPFKRLRDNNKILGGYNYVTNNQYFYTGSTHGTYVLSTMAGYVENQLIGTAPDASYYLFVTEDDLTESPLEESYWVEAAEKADSLGVDIITTSLGYFGDHDKPAYDYTYADMTGNSTFISRGANIAFSRGMFVVASAGNEGANTEPHIGSPADAFSVLAVGAVNSSRIRASFSSIGPSYDNRVKPDVMAQGQSTVLSDEKGNIISASGTSFSGPVIAGMVACLWQALPTKTNQEIKDIIVQSADKFENPNAEYGYGIPDFNSALSTNFPNNSNLYDSIKLYPNPTSNVVYVDFPENLNKGKVIFYSVLGNVVFEKNQIEPMEPISILKLTNGMYFYKLEFNDFSKSGKFLKL